jgi:uncharacterized membrane protein
VIAGKFPLRLVLTAIAAVLYLALGHFAAASDHPPVYALVAGIVPLVVLAVLTAWKSRFRVLALLLCATVILMIALNLEALRGHAAWVYFVQHAGAMMLLGVTFGVTLNSGDAGAICSRMAILVASKPLDARYLRYTWKVTLAWTIYFALSAAISVALFFGGAIEVWSIFANLLTPLLIGAMFAGEYMIRVRVLPDGGQVGIAETIRAYREYSRR